MLRLHTPAGRVGAPARALYNRWRGLSVQYVETCIDNPPKCALPHSAIQQFRHGAEQLLTTPSSQSEQMFEKFKTNGENVARNI